MSNQDGALTKNRLSKKELWSLFWRYQFMVESAMSYEKMHGAAWAWTYTKLGDKYYKDKPEEYTRLLTRHSVFYNTEPQTGQLVNGIVASLEEQIGMGNKDVDEQLPVTIKASIMGPLAGIGDSVVQGILIPTLLSIGMGLAAGGNPIGPIFYILAYGLIMAAVTIISFRSGYKLGISALDVVTGENARNIMKALNTLGIIVVGGLSASTVVLKTGLNIPMGSEMKPLQDVLNGVFPGILALIMVLLSWYLISVKRMSATKVILILIAIIAAGVVIGLF